MLRAAIRPIASAAAAAAAAAGKSASRTHLRRSSAVEWALAERLRCLSTTTSDDGNDDGGGVGTTNDDEDDDGGWLGEDEYRRMEEDARNELVREWAKIDSGGGIPEYASREEALADIRRDIDELERMFAEEGGEGDDLGDIGFDVNDLFNGGGDDDDDDNDDLEIDIDEAERTVSFPLGGGGGPSSASASSVPIPPPFANGAAGSGSTLQQQRRAYSTSAPRTKKWYDDPPARGPPVKEIDGILVDADGNICIPEDDPKFVMMMNVDDMTQEEAQALMDAEYEEYMAKKEANEYRDWKKGTRKRPLVKSYDMDDFDDDRELWTHLDKRCGALGIKMGMMPVWDEWGERHPCTVIYLDTNVVVQGKTQDKDGYNAVQLGAGERKKKNVPRAVMGIYERHGVSERPPFLVREFRVSSPDHLPPVGSRIHASHFVPGQNVDVAGVTKGKGFQGAMKRWGFAGMPASHGTSKSHRALGSTGQCQDPGKVFKGKKMAGRMGNERRTVQNLRVVKVDRGRDLLYVRGAIPGNKGQFVEIRDAIKRPLWGTDKVEGGPERTFPPLPTFEYEEGVDGCGKPGFEVMMPLSQVDPFEPDMNERELTLKDD